jgi:purine-binding chemotaxis protein CheW
MKPRMDASDQRTRRLLEWAQRLAEPPPPTVKNGENEPLLDLAVLEFGQSAYGLELSALLEVMPAVVIPLPLAPHGVAGLINVRGRMITVLNAAVLLGLDDTTPGQLVVLVESESYGTVGLLVTRVPTLRHVDLTKLEPTTEPFMRGVIENIQWLELESWLAQLDMSSSQGGSAL